MNKEQMSSLMVLNIQYNYLALGRLFLHINQRATSALYFSNGLFTYRWTSTEEFNHTFHFAEMHVGRK